MPSEPLRPGIQQHIWEVWHGENQEICGRIISEWRPSQLARLYEYNYKIEGREHIYFISSHDSITRAEAVFFARQEYEGKIRRINIDLRGVSR